MTLPGEERTWFLDGVAGWRIVESKGVVLTDELYLRLESLPGDSEPLVPLEAQALSLRCPSAVTAAPCREVFVADAGLDRVLVVEADARCAGPIVPLDDLGGPGTEARRLLRPRGLALLSDGALAVADTGNHRVQVFSSGPRALLQMWGRTGVLGEPLPGAGALEFERPWGIAADARDTLWIVDRGNGRVQHIARDGTWIEEVGAGVLEDPTGVAIDGRGRLAVVDRGGDGMVQILADSVWSALPKPSHARSVAYGPDGTLYVGDKRGRVHVLRPTNSDGFAYAGAGVSGLDGEVASLIWHAGRLILVLAHGEAPSNPRLWTMQPQAASALSGTVLFRALDSEVESCVWHRLLLDADVPEATSVTIESATTADDSPKTLALVREPAYAGWTHCLTVTGGRPDCLVQSAAGQFLWTRLTLRSDGRASPVLHWLKAFFPRVGYLEYLPAVYREDEESRHFLERFLALFQTAFDDFDVRIDDLWKLFEPAAVPARHLRWLAAWLALEVDPEWPAAKTRSVLASAFEDYARRGTKDGILRAIETYAGVAGASLLEHFRLRQWPILYGGVREESEVPEGADTDALRERVGYPAQPLCGGVRLWSRGFHKRLQLSSYSQLGYFRLTGRPEPVMEPFDWGAHEFTVFFPADAHEVEETRERVSAAVERGKPAHTRAVLCPVLPRMRVGVQATLGIDSRVADFGETVLNRVATLGFDSILGCTSYERGLREMDARIEPRLGSTTTLH